MDKRNLMLWCVPALVLLVSCNSSGSSSQDEKPIVQPKFKAESVRTGAVIADSTALTKLVRDLYKWHETGYQNNGFPFARNSSADTILTGVDWKAYNKEAEIFKQTGLFTQEFLDNHRAIAATIDSSIKKAPIEWRNFNDGVPLWSTNSDDWCGCQDSPDNYWERLKISQLKIKNNAAAFNWNWGTEDGVDPPHQYNMKAVKENGVWRISYMDGFSHYGTVAYYDSMMNSQK